MSLIRSKRADQDLGSVPTIPAAAEHPQVRAVDDRLRPLRARLGEVERRMDEVVTAFQVLAGPRETAASPGRALWESGGLDSSAAVAHGADREKLGVEWSALATEVRILREAIEAGEDARLRAVTAARAELREAHREWHRGAVRKLIEALKEAVAWNSRLAGLAAAARASGYQIEALPTSVYGPIGAVPGDHEGSIAVFCRELVRLGVLDAQDETLEGTGCGRREQAQRAQRYAMQVRADEVRAAEEKMRSEAELERWRKEHGIAARPSPNGRPEHLLAFEK